MQVKKLSLDHFRNYESCVFEPGPGINLIVGENAQGKTNLLEAIFYCCFGRSHRTSRDKEMIAYDAPQALIRLESVRTDTLHELSVRLSQAEGRRIKADGLPLTRIGELMGLLNCVLFAPEHLSIVKDGPAERRRFLDMQLSQLRPQYFYSLQRAVRTLNQRNALLKEIAKHPSLLPTLDMWDEQLARVGAEIAQSRRQAIAFLDEEARRAHASLTDGREELRLWYISQTVDAPDAAEQLLGRLRAARSEDLRRMTTTVGIHRDDMGVTINGKEARTFASQGQQRSAVLSLKLAQLEMAARETGEAPILMLDDVMSELDPQRRRQLIERIDRVQTFVTCTDLSDLAGARQGAVYHVENGSLRA